MYVRLRYLCCSEGRRKVGGWVEGKGYTRCKYLCMYLITCKCTVNHLTTFLTSYLAEKDILLYVEVHDYTTQKGIRHRLCR